MSNGKTYVCVKTGNVLQRMQNQFHWQGRFFSGLVDVEANALYDDPEDSFAAVVGLASSLDGLIAEKA